jgi:aldehyde:ferredoxin oxidoreductase
MFIGGRGLGIKILWDRLKRPGINPLSPENPLMFMPGPFSGFPVPSASRTCVVTKSPCTSPFSSSHEFASTVSYSSMGGFFGPEIRFAGYDGIVITGKAASPVCIVIDDDRVEIRDAKKYWGMKTDAFDRQFIEELGDRRFRTCYIGPAGENLVSYSCIIHTAARAAGRGTGCVMGSKNLKAIAVKGSRMPDVEDNEQFIARIEKSRKYFKGISTGTLLTMFWKNDGMAKFLEKNSKKGILTVIVHDGPEYETGTMFGANLLVSDLEGLMKAIFDGDDYGLDIISTGNVIGFLMEAYEKGYIDKDILDGIDLKWGNVDAILEMIEKIAMRKGIGELASKGVKAVSQKIGKDSEKFAIHVKGLELAAWNVHAYPAKGISYTTSNRGACHHNGDDIDQQNFFAMMDCLGICSFATDQGHRKRPGLDKDDFADLLTAITGVEWTGDELMKAGERVFNLEKMFNYREGFRREDDKLPERFFEEPLTIGSEKGAVLNREEFNEMLDQYYRKRGWDPKTTKPDKSKLDELGLSFALKEQVKA